MRLAWQERPGASLRHLVRWRIGAHAGPMPLVQAYLSRHGLPMAATVAMGVAADLDGDLVQFTNHAWSFSRDALAQACGDARLVLMNDFEALAWSLTALPPMALQAVGGGQGCAQAPRAVIGPGTGLGVSALLHLPRGRWVALQGEGGHVTLPVSSDREHAVVKVLTRRFGHASAERALSGPGLVHVHQALCELDGLDMPERTPEQVARAGLEQSDRACRETLELFAGWLGSVAGNLALTLGARGGVYLGGGILPHLCPWFIAESSFRARFEAKGRFSAYLQQIPVWIVDDPWAALRGLARALDEQGDQAPCVAGAGSSMPPIT